MANLRTGHSHEDIDQCFGRLAGYLHKQPMAQCPEDFVPLIQQWLNGAEFPFEPYRVAFLFNRVRDWCLELEAKLVYGTLAVCLGFNFNVN